ncbi:MAG: 6-carboxytetrahydropterin synthase QueD [Candidatus Omnitrophica bacterium CG1_02_49_10]|nr:MAG: 6-carboxytetrahydropterin synthase QueD [Candidatus Omnitrophica bacterium CG1_02_49_10]
MYEVKVRSSFSAAHNLRNYRGKCEKLHGHNWMVEAAAASQEVDKNGMVIDFVLLKKALKKILMELDHSYLNKHPYFKKANPSSENIAKYIYDKLRMKLPAVRHAVSSVKVWETEGSCAEYREE